MNTREAIELMAGGWEMRQSWRTWRTWLKKGPERRKVSRATFNRLFDKGLVRRSERRWERGWDGLIALYELSPAGQTLAVKYLGVPE